mgnify:CR=1 FL=1
MSQDFGYAVTVERTGGTWRVREFEDEAERLINTTMTDAAFAELTATVFGTVGRDASPRAKRAEHRRTDALTGLWADANTQAGVRHTAWAGYQSVVEYIDHFAPVRTKGDAATARATRLLTSDDPTRIKHKAWAALTPA